MKIISLLQSGIPGGRRGWTIPFLILLSSGLTNFLQAQAPPPEPAQSVPQQLSPEELNRLLAPIALYPDALVALILPASTVPSDLVLAARYLVQMAIQRRWRINRGTTVSSRSHAIRMF